MTPLARPTTPPYSAEQTRKAGSHNAKVELRELIQQLTELPQRNVDLNSKYADNPWTSASRSLGQAAFAAGDLDQGRASNQEALNVFKRFPTRNSYFMRNSYFIWSTAPSPRSPGPAPN